MSKCSVFLNRRTLNPQKRFKIRNFVILGAKICVYRKKAVLLSAKLHEYAHMRTRHHNIQAYAKY